MAPLVVNGREIDPARIRAEAERQRAAPDPEAAARRALAVRELLLERAAGDGLFEGRSRSEVSFADAAAEDAVIERVLDLEVRTPEPNEEECRRHYLAHPAQFRAGDLVEASHILFALTARVPPGALRARAAEVHAAARREPPRFAELARKYSNCPSAAQGGSLGRLGRGDTVPEFERALFATDVLGVLPELVDSRHGFHVVLVARRIAGEPLPFEAVRERIAASLRARSTERALAQFVQVLAGEADLQGVDLTAATGPLVQ
jgi:peptidyl-prolyl cis-trans isomerase C